MFVSGERFTAWRPPATRLAVPIVAVLVTVSLAVPVSALWFGNASSSPVATSISNPLGEAIASLASGSGPAQGAHVACTESTLTQADCNLASSSLGNPPTAGAGNGTWISLTQGRSYGGMTYDPMIGRVVLFGGENASGALGDTWTYREGTWSQVLTSPSPSARELASLTYDTKDNYVLLFGGFNGSSYLNDTWTYQSGNWQQLSTPVAPSPRDGAAISYDPMAGSIVLFGGYNGVAYLNDTWKFSGGAWTLLTTSGAIPARAESAMAYDGAIHTLLLFGGKNVTGYLADTWTYLNKKWTDVAPSNSPSARSGAGIAFDSATGALILFGGQGAGGPLGDTWSYAPGVWTNLGVSGPGARAGALLTYDAAATDRELLLVSGVGGGPTYLHDTWGYTNAWSLLLTGASPPSRSGAAMVWDPLDSVAMLFGGFTGTSYLNDTWEYVGGTWTPLVTPVAPSPRAGASMVFVGANATATYGFVLLFGGYNGANYLNDTWEFVAGAWTPLATVHAPSPRAGAATTFSTYTNSTVFFGGIGASGYLQDTWWFSGANDTWFETSPSSPPSARAYAGVTYDPLNDTMLLFGGVGSGGYLNDTWELHGGNQTIRQTWTQDLRTVAPSPRANATLAWDTVSRYAILVGGNGGSGVMGDAWAWVQKNWTPITSMPAPSSRSGAVAVFDAADYTWILFGGNRPTGTVNDTWQWVVFIIRSFATLDPVDATAVEQFYPTVFEGVSPYTYQWGFGDTGSSTLRAPTHVYAAPGNYSVVLTVDDSAGNSSTVLLNITVNPALAITAHASPSPVDAGTAVSFTATETLGTAPVTTVWTFGDGGSSTLLDPTYAYSVPGTYNATLWVNDSGGLSLNDTVPIIVSASPVAEVVASPVTTDVGSAVNFTGVVSGGTEPYTYQWLFGDGSKNEKSSSATTESVFHNYSSAGTFLAQLWVNDTFGASAYSNETISVNPALGGTIAAAPTTVETGRAVSFWGNESGGTAPFAIAWRFGDGTTGTGAQPTHAYTAAGTYLVNLWINDSVNQSIHQTVSVTVTQGPVVSGRPSHTATDVGFAVDFTATVTGGVAPYTIAWRFGDGGSASGTSTSHSYATAGQWTVTVWGNDSQGGSSHQSFSVLVNPLLAVTSFSVSPTNPAVGSSMEFTVLVTGGTGVLSYAYAGLPVGCSSHNASTMSCTPNGTGVFNVTVTVTDSLGATSAHSVQVTVQAASAKSPATFLGLSGDWGYYLLIGVILVVILIIAAVILTRRSRSTTETETTTTTTGSPTTASSSEETPKSPP